jgi:hypothetical protein
MDGKITITKVPEVSAAPPPAAGKRKVTQRTFPKGILKLKPVADPAKPPPLKRSTTRRTIRLMTERGIRKRRKTIKKTIKRMSDAKVKELVQKAGLLKNPDTPVSLMRQMLEGGTMAGLVSV